MPRGRLPEGAKKFWRKYAQGLEAVGVLTEPDLPAFEMMAWHFHFALKAGEQLEREGLAVMDSKDQQLKKHPLNQVFRENSAALRMYATEFGMTPSGRSRLQPREKEGQLSLAEMLFAEVDSGEK
jgi:P27 family predicted phage terminase small subunit